MKKELTRHNLEYKKTIDYVKDQLANGYSLSSQLSIELDFANGQFFTLLPADADLERIYNFFVGLILPQNPTYEQIGESGKKSYYTWIPTLKNELSNFVFEKIQLKNSNACIFEDVKRRLEDPHIDFFRQYGFRYLNEMYYLISKKIATLELIRSAIGKSDALWHLVFILTEIDDYEDLRKEITLDNMKAYCRKTQLLVLGAYDGEGYVFWEPNK